MNNETEFLREGYAEILELIEDNAELGGGVYSPEELLEKIIEVSETRLLGEI